MVKYIKATLHQDDDETQMTTTAKTLLGTKDMNIPSWVRELTKIIVKAHSSVATPAMPLTGLCEVESNSVSLTPYQVFAPPIGATLGVAQTAPPKPEEYDMFVPVNGGEFVSIYGTNLISPTTVTSYMGATLVVTNKRSVEPVNVDVDGSVITPESFYKSPQGQVGAGTYSVPGMPNLIYKPQVHAKVGTITATGTTAASAVAGTRYNISGAEEIIELMGVMQTGAIILDLGFGGYVKYTSSDFEGVNDVRLPLNGICGGDGTTQQVYIDGVSRLKVNVPVKSKGQVFIQDSALFSTISSTAGTFVDGVLYR